MSFSPKNSYNKEEILDCAQGNLFGEENGRLPTPCLLYTSPSPRDQRGSRMPSSA